MIDINIYCNNLQESDGIFFSKKHSEISYPESGNDICLLLEDESFWFKHRNDCIIEAVKNYSPNKLFFDIGGGNGFVGRDLERSGIENVLVEPGVSGARNAKSRNAKNIICSTFEDAGFKENSIPAVGLFDVVEHIEDDLGFLKNIFNCMSDGAIIFITVPAYQALWSNEDKEGGHFRRYTRSGLATRLKQTGFEIQYSSYIFSILPIFIFLFRTIPSRLGLSGKQGELEKYKEEHKKKRGVFSGLLGRIWKWEVGNIKVGREMEFGGSCFVIAKKVTATK